MRGGEINNPEQRFVTPESIKTILDIKLSEGRLRRGKRYTVGAIKSLIGELKAVKTDSILEVLKNMADVSIYTVQNYYMITFHDSSPRITKKAAYELTKKLEQERVLLNPNAKDDENSP
jgi:hypothetical protein